MNAYCIIIINHHPAIIIISSTRKTQPPPKQWLFAILVLFLAPSSLATTHFASRHQNSGLKSESSLIASMHASRSETEMTQHKTARANQTNEQGSTLNPLYKHATNADVTDEEKKSSQEEFKNHAIVYDFSLPNNAAPSEDYDTTNVCADPESKFQSDRSLLWSTPIIYSIVTLFSVIAVSYLMFLTSNTIDHIWW